MSIHHFADKALIHCFKDTNDGGARREEEPALKHLLRITILLIGLIWILAWAAAGRFDDASAPSGSDETPTPTGEIAAPGERDSAKRLRIQIQGDLRCSHA